VLSELSSIEPRRRRLGLTQLQLAKAAQVSQSLVAKVESGAVDPAYSRARALLEALDSLESKSKPTAGEVMTPKVHSVRPGELVKNVAAFMRRHQISQMPVVEGGSALGSVSEKAILDRIASQEDYAKIAHLKAKDIMEEAFPVVSPSTPIGAVAELLKSFPAVLVRKGSEFCGIITKADLLKAVNS
jgi:predicted transcriptional regulator